MTKKKNFSKNPNKKKQKSTTHPYVELIQSEITALEDKLTSLQNTETELTQEQEMDKLVTKATLERYKETLQKTTESSFLSKVQNHHASLIEEGKKKQELQFLTTMQLFYLMRLGQLGLFQFMDTNAVVPLESIADLCDQMIGAAVHFANTPATSLKTRHEYKAKVFSLIRKLDSSADEPLRGDNKEEEKNSSGTTFKQVKEFLDHLWENTDKLDTTAAVASPPPLLEQADYPVLQFDTMMPTQQKDTATTTSSSQDEEMQEPVTPKTSLSISTATTHEEPKPLVTAEEPITHNDENKVEKETVTYNGWGSSEDVTKKSAWGSEREPEENVTAPSNKVDSNQSTEKKREEGFVENASTTSTSTTKSSKREKDTEKRKKKKDSDGKKKDKSEEKKHKEPKEVEQKEPKEVEQKESKEAGLPKKEESPKDSNNNAPIPPTEEIVSSEREPKQESTTAPVSEDNGWGKTEKEDNRGKQSEESSGWTTSFNTIDIKKGGWDSPDDASKPVESKDWEELKNNFGDITISEDPPVTTSDVADDSWKYGYSHGGGRGRGRGRGGRGRGYSGSGYQPRGGYRGSSNSGSGSRPPRGRGSGDFSHRRYEQQQHSNSQE